NSTSSECRIPLRTLILALTLSSSSILSRGYQRVGRVVTEQNEHPRQHPRPISTRPLTLGNRMEEICSTLGASLAPSTMCGGRNSSRSAFPTISFTNRSASPWTTESMPPKESTNSWIQGSLNRVAGASCQAHGPPAMILSPRLRASTTAGCVSIRLKLTQFRVSFFITPPNVELGGLSPK